MDRNNLGSGRLETRPKCTECGTLLDGFTGNVNDRPSDGDYTICGYCGNIGKYANGLSVIQTLTLEELKDLRESKPKGWAELQRGRQMVLRIIEKRKGTTPDFTSEDGTSFSFK